MQLDNNDEQQMKKLNEQMQKRAAKFGSEFTPLTNEDYQAYKIKKASETGNTKFLQRLALPDIENQQQRNKTILQRKKKFFECVNIESDQDKFFKQKVIPDFSDDNLQVRQNAWHVFGVDYMSNERLRNYFINNPNFKIQWINDSSCNLVFKTKQQAQQALKPHFKQNSKRQQQSQIWYQLNEYEVQGIQRKLYCRLATNKDTKQQTAHGHQSKYYRWIINKDKINHFVKQAAKKQIRLNKTKRIAKDRVNAAKKQEEQNSDSSSDVQSQVQKLVQIPVEQNAQKPKIQPKS